MSVSIIGTMVRDCVVVDWLVKGVVEEKTNDLAENEVDILPI